MSSRKKKTTTSNLSDDVSDVLFVLCTEVRSDFHQDRRFVFSLQGIALLQHLHKCVRERVCQEMELQLLNTKSVYCALRFEVLIVGMVR